MCSAIISDTLLFRSPTCTDEDRIAGHELSQIAGLDLKAYAHEMFFAGSNLSEKTAKELFTSDYKKFSLGDVTFGIGQVSSMDSDELAQVRNKIYSYLPVGYISSSLLICSSLRRRPSPGRQNREAVSPISAHSAPVLLNMI